MAFVIPWVGSHQRALSWAAWTICAALALGLAATASRGGLVAAAIAGVLVTWQLWRQHPWRIGTVVAVAVVIAMMLPGGQRWSGTLADPSVNTRLDLWWSSLAMIMDNPLGLWSLPGSWASTWYVPTHVPPNSYRSLISSPLTILATTGWVAWWVMAMVGCTIVIRAFGCVIARPHDRWAAGATGALVAVVVSSVFSSVHLMPGVNVILGITMITSAWVVFARPAGPLRTVPIALAAGTTITLVLLVMSWLSAIQHPLVACPHADGAQVFRRSSTGDVPVRILLPNVRDPYNTRRFVQEMLDDRTTAVVVHYDPERATVATWSSTDILVLVGGIAPHVLAQTPAVLPAALVLVDAPLSSPVPDRSVRRLLSDWPVPLVVVGSDDLGEASALAAALQRRHQSVVVVEHAGQALAAVGRMQKDRDQAPRFHEPDRTVTREPGQSVASIAYRVVNRSKTTLRLGQLVPLCSCYSMDPSQWRNIPAGAVGEFTLLVDLRPFLVGEHKPLLLKVVGEVDGVDVTWDVIGTLDVQVRCTLELADGPRAVLRDGFARLRLLSSRPDMIASVALSVDDTGISATSSPRSTGYDLRFEGSPTLDRPATWAVVVTLTNGVVERLTGTVCRAE